MKKFYFFLFLLAMIVESGKVNAQHPFVSIKNHRFESGGKLYTFIGANYWYGGLLGAGNEGQKGKSRLATELDFLKAHGVNNLRVPGGVEGVGIIKGVTRAGPALQPQKGVFSEKVMNGLDLLLYEMGKRNMKAVIYLSNNWEWSGGFLQYLQWNGRISAKALQSPMNWEQQSSLTSKFYGCEPCRQDYLRQVKYIITHKNRYTGKKYSEDPTIMAWELANEPRPMRVAASEAYADWIREAAAAIKSIDKNHLVTTGSEGEMGSGSLAFFKRIHEDAGIDYMTIHIWPKNWRWFSDTTIYQGMSNIITKTDAYLQQHLKIAQELDKPLVIEEFGLPRDGHSYEISSGTTLRDSFYTHLFEIWDQQQYGAGYLGGLNFWAFGGTARPKAGHVFWKQGDDYMGDPPTEEQGLNTVFDSDKSTWKLISYYSGKVYTNDPFPRELPADSNATKETVNLYNNLRRLEKKGVLFGHQDDPAYGVNWKYVPGRSDVKEVTGDYPGIFGFDISQIENDHSVNIDSVPFDRIKQYIREAYGRGQVITISWHNNNPLTGSSAWDTTHGAVAAVLPGGEKNELYNSWLDKVAAFMLNLKGSKGEAIPVLFRPYHELTGNWFWWCRNTCTPDQFKALWKYTVEYLRGKNVHNLLLIYNTADFSDKTQFLERYPGDDYVDMLSFDKYQYGDPLKDSGFIKSARMQLDVMSDIALERNKLSAFGETGYEGIPYADWWTKTLWPAISGFPISYVLVWRNAGLRPGSDHSHYYAPYKGQVSADDFIRFYKLDKTLFGTDVSRETVYE